MSVFLLSIKGQIEMATIPEIPELFVKYQFVYGEDWIVTTGIEEGITQICQRYDPAQDFVFNFPLDVTFKSTNPRGWPQIVLCAYGRDTWGQEVIRGYGVCFVPLSLGSNIRKTVGLFVPNASSVASKLSTVISGRSPELYDPRILTRNRGREVLRTNSKGCVHLVFNLVGKDTQRLGYALASKERPAMVQLLESNDRDSLLNTSDKETGRPPAPTVPSVTNQFHSLTMHDRGDYAHESIAHRGGQNDPPLASRNRRQREPELRSPSPPEQRRPSRAQSPSPQSSSRSHPASAVLSPRITVVRRLQEEKEQLESFSPAGPSPAPRGARRESELPASVDAQTPVLY